MKSHKVLIFFAVVVAVLGAMCCFWPAEGITIGSLTLRFPTLQRIMAKEDAMDVDAYLKNSAQEEELRRIQDSNTYYHSLLTECDTRFWIPNDDSTFFDALFAAMEQTPQSGRTIRVLHYGDSQIEMDHMTDRLRARFQEEFGGGGPGLLPLYGFTPVTSAQVWANGAITKISSFGDSTVSRSSGNYGPMMQCHRIEGGASSGITPTNRKEASPYLSQISTVKVLFNNRSGSFAVTVNARPIGFSDTQRSTSCGVDCLCWQFDSCVSKLNFNYSGSADIYGIMADNGPGVAVDNIPMRGCSGHQFRMVDYDLLSGAYAKMDVGMVIMQFGGNSLPYISTQKALDHYCKELGEQIDYVRQCCPKAVIVFIGPSDMSKSVGGSRQSYPFLPEYVAGLRDMALQHGAAYWSIYDAMGGWNSMLSWVDQGYAGKDYMHFSQKGADIMGDRLADAFMAHYRYYQFRKSCREKEVVL